MPMTDAAPPPPPADDPAPQPAADGGTGRSRGRRIAVRALLCAGTLVAVLSIFAVWANRQVLNADNWSTTSAEMLSNSAIRAQISTYLVDQVYANTDVTAEIAN